MSETRYEYTRSHQGQTAVERYISVYSFQCQLAVQETAERNSTWTAEMTSIQLSLQGGSRPCLNLILPFPSIPGPDSSRVRDSRIRVGLFR